MLKQLFFLKRVVLGNVTFLHLMNKACVNELFKFLEQFKFLFMKQGSNQKNIMKDEENSYQYLASVF